MKGTMIPPKIRPSATPDRKFMAGPMVNLLAAVKLFDQRSADAKTAHRGDRTATEHLALSGQRKNEGNRIRHNRLKRAMPRSRQASGHRSRAYARIEPIRRW